MLYGLGVATPDIAAAKAALPDCLSQELSNCIDHDNVGGLPKAQCDAIVLPYRDQASGKAMDDAINALPICSPPSMVPYVGAAFAAGVLLTVMFVRR
jgi:hypothetical protein